MLLTQVHIASRPMKIVRTTIALLLVVLGQASPRHAVARWDVIFDFREQMSFVYFIDKDIGFSGTGNFNRTGIPRIFKTVDGGMSWRRVNTPHADFAFVASITMNGATGYAAINAQDVGTSLWKTTDEGENWFDESPDDAWDAVDVIDVGGTIMLSTWQGGGWIRRQSSVVWTEEANEGFEYRTNGMASNGTDIIVTGWRDAEWFSNDGGQTWSRSDDIPEAWSVYSLAGTRTFFTASEGPTLNPTRSIFRTTDGGNSWEHIFGFDPDISFTGHIDGMNNTLYVQTDLNSNEGIFRSDDLGLTWKAVQGPSCLRDSRFEVTGCGQIVYALDRFGRLHKTTDGGDGTLDISSGNNTLSLQQDTLFIQGNSCEPTRTRLNFNNRSCSDIQIDSITASASRAVIDLEKAGSRVVLSGKHDSVIFNYSEPQDPIDTTILTIHTSDGNKKNVVIVARNLLALNFRLGDPESKNVGEMVSVPIYVSEIPLGSTVSSASFKMRVAQNLLGNWSVTQGSVIPLEEAVLIHLSWTPPLSSTTDRNLPVAVLTAKNFLTTTRFTDLTLDSVGVTSNGSVSPCSSFTTSYTQLENCADTTLRLLLLQSNLPSIVSVGPVPFKYKSWVATKFGEECELRIVDMLGRDHSGKVKKETANWFEIDATSLNAGTYMLLLTRNGQVIDTRNVVKSQ